MSGHYITRVRSYFAEHRYFTIRLVEGFYEVFDPDGEFVDSQASYRNALTTAHYLADGDEESRAAGREREDAQRRMRS